MAQIEDRKYLAPYPECEMSLVSIALGPSLSLPPKVLAKYGETSADGRSFSVLESSQA